MSGGAFDYKQYQIGYIADQIEEYLYKCKNRIQKDWTFNDNPQYFEEPEDIQNLMREAVAVLRTAQVYAQRVDWYLSGDDGPEYFKSRLIEDLQKLAEKDKQSD